ncbi:MAG: PQQ-binding-like beta-propeller repeat protein, partial [Verrucomicrobiota bacterium]
AGPWKEWLSANGKTATLDFPLRTSRWVDSSLNGHTLMALLNKNRVVKYDENMNEIWSYTCIRPNTAEMMENGNILISSYQKNRIIEVTPEKKVIREISVEEPNSARPLANGHILVTSRKSGAIREINREGEIVRQIERKGCLDALLLENGNILIVEFADAPSFGMTFLVAELNPAGQQIWARMTQTKYMPSIQELDNGNVFIGTRNQFIELNRETDKVVWKLNLDQARNAFRRENGNILIRQYDRLIEADPAGTEIWSKSGVSYGTMRQ